MRDVMDVITATLTFLAAAVGLYTVLLQYRMHRTHPVTGAIPVSTGPTQQSSRESTIRLGETFFASWKRHALGRSNWSHAGFALLAFAASLVMYFDVEHKTIKRAEAPLAFNEVMLFVNFWLFIGATSTYVCIIFARSLGTFLFAPGHSRVILLGLLFVIVGAFASAFQFTDESLHAATTMIRIVSPLLGGTLFLVTAVRILSNVKPK